MDSDEPDCSAVADKESGEKGMANLPIPDLTFHSFKASKPIDPRF